MLQPDNTKKLANRAFHRLQSIRYDVEKFLLPLVIDLGKTNKPWLVANERCGTWYTLPLLQCYGQKLFKSCYFKSTDGHVHFFSLKRLNFELLHLFQDSNRILIVDASVRKILPDSFSRTIPIWCCVLNRIARRYRQERGLFLNNDTSWDEDLHTPEIIEQKEKVQMVSEVEEHVETLYQCGALVDIDGFLELLLLPLYPVWITPDSGLNASCDRVGFNYIVCINASKQSKPRVQWKERFWYTPGAADDEESWSQGVNAHEFWHSARAMPSQGTDEVDEWLGQIVATSEKESNETDEDLSKCYDWIDVKSKKLAIGSRRAGKPPVCWDYFDAVLNVTESHYPGMDSVPTSKFYLQLPVKEGKRGDLENWLATGIVFCLYHLQTNRRILIHCAQGKDRSVAVALSVILLGTNLQYPLEWSLGSIDFESSVPGDLQLQYKSASSGLSAELINLLQGNQGRDYVLKWCQLDSGDTSNLNKKVMRIALHLIRQDRSPADPTRSTMQKLNRFFLSRSFDPNYHSEP